MIQQERGAGARPGAVVFSAAFLLFALFLLSQIGAETKPPSRGAIVSQPRFWPAVGVIGMSVFGILHMIADWRRRDPGWRDEVVTWGLSLEYLVWFMLYVFVVPVIGYLLATVGFACLLALRAGYRDSLRLSAAAAFGLAVVLIFKTGLSVRIPGGAIYETLPAGLRNFMILNF